MTASLRAPEDIVNVALGRIGKTVRIGKLTEGSEASKLALDMWGQTRDAILRGGNWDFARRDLNLELLKSAPVGGYVPPNTLWNPDDYPPLPWLYAYQYPADCLKVRSLRRPTVIVRDFDPQPVPYNVPNGEVTVGEDDPVEQKLICCNVASVICTYTGRVTDPSLWDASFTELMIDAVAKRLAPSLNPSLLKPVVMDEMTAKQKADETLG